MERIDKVFSNLGLLSRSECKQAISKGQITVNNTVIKKSDFKVNPDLDQIMYKGELIATSTYVYYMLNKPHGYITATEDKSAATVFDLIDDTRRDLAAVGRLDKDTTGLLLITNDGATNHYLVSPKHHVTKRYEVVIDGVLTPGDVRLIEEGIDIGDDKPTLPAKLEIITDSKPQQVAITITEGRYHQVKRMFGAVGCPVIKLHRSDFGPLHLDQNLEPGTYRPLSPEEIDFITQKGRS